jgi:hypothetical protein
MRRRRRRVRRCEHCQIGTEEPDMPSLTPSSKPHPPGAPKPTPASAAAAPAARKLNWLLIGGAAAALLVIVAALVIWQKATAPPRLNEPTVDIARFAASERFDQLSLAEQRKYMDVLEGRKDELKEAYYAGKLAEPEYRVAKELFWFSDWLGRMDDYYAKSPGQQRLDYLHSLAAKQEKKDDEDDGQKPDNKTGGPKLPKVKRDEISETLRPKRWSAEEQQRWNQFRSALAEVKAAREKAEKEREAAKGPKTRPAE